MTSTQTYHGFLLERICDKLEIDYSDAKQKATEAAIYNENLRQTTLKKLEATDLERQKLRQDREARVMSHQIEKEMQDAEEKRLSQLSPDEIEKLKAAYCAASDEADIANRHHLEAWDNPRLSAIERDQLEEKYRRLQRKADRLRDNLKFATTGTHSRDRWF